MAEATLVVPIQLDALSVNQALLDRDGFRRWRFDYGQLDNFASPEPVAMDASLPGPAPGVHLQWVLPAALRQGARDPVSGELSYPLVPNRWLVTRCTSTPLLETTAWVVESDCPYTEKAEQMGVDVAQTSTYLVDPALAALWAQSPDAYRYSVVLPAPGMTPRATIGIPFDLASWSERDATATFLTALAPSNPVFGIYAPHNAGVFSLFDDMTGVQPGHVSYVVVGWYSDPTADAMASWQSQSSSSDPYGDLLARLDWSVSGQGPGPVPAAEQASRSLYEGMALSVAWDPEGLAVPDAAGDPLAALLADEDALRVGIGNTTIDAFTALVSDDAGVGARGEQLLRAFQYDLLGVLGEVNGEALLERQIRQAWFSPCQAGYEWSIVAGQGQDAATAELSATEAQWLAQLNADQQALDGALQELYDLQWHFNAMWWKNGRWPLDSIGGNPPGVDDQQQLLDQLDPTYVGEGGEPSLAHRLVDQLAAVQELVPRVPQPVAGGADPQSAFLGGIESFAAGKGLDPAKILKAGESARYWQAADPVVVLSGVQPPAESDPDQPLVTRLATDLVSRFEVDGVAVTVAGAGAAAALPESAALPAGVQAIATEWFLLDPANAALIAQATGTALADVDAVMRAHDAPAYAGPLPSIGLAGWSQPWQPMFLEWQVNYVPIDAQPDGALPWSFDGEDYQSDAQSAQAGDAQTVGGISLLSPHAQFVLGSRLSEFLAKYGPDPELQALYDDVFGDGPTQLPYLTQALTGFQEQLGVRDLRAFRRPNPDDLTPSTPALPVADLAGYADSAGGDSLPGRYRGAVASVPYMPGGVSPPFQGVRQGQMWFLTLLLYDKFGRTLTVISDDSTDGGPQDPSNYEAVIDAPMVPSTPIAPNVRSIVELAPRLVQPARLDLDLLDAFDDARALGRDPGANPVCGWLLPNHLDHSISLFAADGDSLGDYRLVESATGTKTGLWDPPPDSVITTLADVAVRSPHLAQMLEAAAIGQESAFEALLDVIDTTLWTTDPLGARRDQTLSVLIGRPLALVRAGLGLRLAGPPLRDSSWAATLDPPEPAFLTQSFAVRLGDLATRDDGVIGYFAADDYEVFNSVAQPQESTAQSYVLPIGSPLADGSSNYLSITPNATSLATLTLLVDPRAGIHATTGTLPVKRVDLPASFVKSALARLGVTFRVQPALTFVAHSPVVAGSPPGLPTSIALPISAEARGTWSFMDQAQGWTRYGVVDAQPNPALTGMRPTLRDGLLKLVIDLERPPPKGGT